MRATLSRWTKSPEERRGFGPLPAEAASYHQQYLDKNPDGYCGLGGTGVTCPVGLVDAE